MPSCAATALPRRYARDDTTCMPPPPISPDEYPEGSSELSSISVWLSKQYAALKTAVRLSPKDDMPRGPPLTVSAQALRVTAGAVGTVESDVRQRAEVLRFWRVLRAVRGDGAWLRVINEADAAEVDLNYPTPDGETILYKAAEHRYVGSVERLLELDVDVNRQVTAMGSDYGNTALHVLASGLHAGQSDSPRCTWNFNSYVVAL